MAYDIGVGFLANVAICVACMVVAGRFGRVRSVAMMGAWIGAVAAVAGAAFTFFSGASMSLDGPGRPSAP